MNKKIILHIIQSLDSGGCENMLLRTLPLIDNFNHVLLTLNKEGELSEKFKERGFEIININQKGFFDLTAYFRLIKTVRKINPDIIITYLFHADIIGRIIIQLFTKYRTIPFLRTTYNHERYWIARLAEKLTKYFVKHYLANSESVKDFYIKNIGVKKERITVIPNGIDINFYNGLKRDWNLRRSFKIKDGDFAIICVSNLHINKGHKYLLKAFEEIYKKNINIKLLIVGDGEERANLLKQMANYYSRENVLFLGKRMDVPQLLKISDIFVLHTLFEGMSNAIIEAMAAGIPVLATDIPENRDLIENEKTGILFPVNDTDSLVKAIEILIADESLRKKLGQNAQQKTKLNFDIRVVASRLDNFYQKI